MTNDIDTGIYGDNLEDEIFFTISSYKAELSYDHFIEQVHFQKKVVAIIITDFRNFVHIKALNLKKYGFDGQGNGKKIINKIIEHHKSLLEEMGEYDYIFLTACFDTHNNSKGFYEKMGFKISNIPEELEGWIDVVEGTNNLMVKKIKW